MYTWREQWLVNGLSENSDEWTGDVKPVGNVHFTLAIVASSRPSSLYFHRTPSFQTITLFRTAPLKNPTLKSRLFYLNQQSSLRDRRNDRAHTDRLKSVHESDGLDNRTPPFGFSLPCPPSVSIHSDKTIITAHNNRLRQPIWKERQIDWKIQLHAMSFFN